MKIEKTHPTQKSGEKMIIAYLDQADLCVVQS